jgi:Flp pilus assembly pilin Flp
MHALSNAFQNKPHSTAIEYALILALVAGVVLLRALTLQA